MRKILHLTLILTAITFSACYYYPNGLTDAEDQLIAASQVDAQYFELGNPQTFYVVDSMSFIQDGKDQGRQVNNYKAQIISKMNSLGYQQVEDPHEADLFINTTFIKTINVTLYSFGWWYSSYPFDFWGWYYPVFFPPNYPIFVSSYSSGCLIIEMASETERNGARAHLNRWYGLVRGLSTGNHSEDEVRRFLDKCFDITPELERK